MRTTEPRNYRWGELEGWIVEHRSRLTRRDKSTYESVTYWYGPDRTWGTSSGPLDRSAPVWPTRKAAEAALTKVFGSLSVVRRRAYTAKRLLEVPIPKRYLYQGTTGRRHGKKRPVIHACSTGYGSTALCGVHIPGMPEGRFDPSAIRTCSICKRHAEEREREWEEAESQRVARLGAVA